MSLFTGIKMAFIRRKLRNRRVAERTPILKQTTAYKRVLILSNTKPYGLGTAMADLFPSAEIICAFAPKKKTEEAVPENHYPIYPDDFNLTGRLKNDKLKNLMQTTFDLVVDLSKNEPLLLYILQHGKHTFMIGEKEKDQSFMYDLLLDKSKNETAFLKDIKQQITLLSVNNGSK